ncbi:TRIC cation channel family protein [Burkholderia gladioli]|uniref:TRIC cation channel family protein n=1 Tax=Burkholderia gladioli TaxID=28095 RepID=UPI0012FD6774|nr:hypothetical protein [Burkholderia gladioli]
MRAGPAVLLGAALASLVLAACANQNPNERITGTGGGMIRYSSRQVTVDLTPPNARGWRRYAITASRVPRQTTPSRR